jgi:hypothetical protein
MQHNNKPTDDKPAELTMLILWLVLAITLTLLLRAALDWRF